MNTRSAMWKPTNKDGNLTLADDKKIPCVVLYESDLPCFVFVVGKMRKTWSYCLDSVKGTGIIMEKCDSKFKTKMKVITDGNGKLVFGRPPEYVLTELNH